MNTSKVLLTIGAASCFIGVIAMPSSTPVGMLLLLGGILAFAGGRFLKEM